MPEPAESALGPVSRKHAAAKHPLVQPPADDRQGVLGPKREVGRGQQCLRPPLLAHRLVERQDELVPLGLLANEPHRDMDQVDAGLDALQPGERFAELHRSPERKVVGVFCVGAAPLVPRVVVGPDVVLVRTILGPQAVGREDRQGRVVPAHLPDARLPNERDPAPIELETLQVVP